MISVDQYKSLVDSVSNTLKTTIERFKQNSSKSFNFSTGTSVSGQSQINAISVTVKDRTTNQIFSVKFQYNNGVVSVSAFVIDLNTNFSNQQIFMCSDLSVNFNQSTLNVDVSNTIYALFSQRYSN